MRTILFTDMAEHTVMRSGWGTRRAGARSEEGGDLFGATVIMASRIAAFRGAGEVVAADVVRALCARKGFLFADRRENVLRGCAIQYRCTRCTGGKEAAPPAALKTCADIGLGEGPQFPEKRVDVGAAVCLRKQSAS